MHAIPHAKMSYFTTYTGVRLPLKLLNPLSADEVQNRNTYFSAYYNEAEELIAIQKLVYGEVELTHRYDYHPDGTLRRAEITEAGDAPRELLFEASA